MIGARLAPPAPISRPPPTQPAPAHTSVGYAAVALRYSESAPVLVQGPVTRREYHFSSVQPVQSVDARDAPALLRTRFFQRV
jgi:hypothetical protein